MDSQGIYIILSNNLDIDETGHISGISDLEQMHESFVPSLRMIFKMAFDSTANQIMAFIRDIWKPGLAILIYNFSNFVRFEFEVSENIHNGCWVF